LEFTMKNPKQIVCGLAKDISVGGLFVATVFPPAVGSNITMRVRLPGLPEEVVIPGVVRWRHPEGMGVQFGAIGAREMRAIGELVARNADERSSVVPKAV
jgi:type IV pilus assembly protein PilZ